MVTVVNIPQSGIWSQVSFGLAVGDVHDEKTSQVCDRPDRPIRGFEGPNVATIRACVRTSLHDD